MFVIFKKSRLYLGGVGYTGVTCTNAGVEQGKRYLDKDEAERDAKKLSECNPVGFEVLDWKPAEETS